MASPFLCQAAQTAFAFVTQGEIAAAPAVPASAAISAAAFFEATCTKRLSDVGRRPQKRCPKPSIASGGRA